MLNAKHAANFLARVSQPAVSRISNPPALESSYAREMSGGLPNGIRRYSKLEICATYKRCILAGVLVWGLTVSAQTNSPGGDRWVAPARAAARKNPVAANETSIALGKKTYERHCLACHGKTGKGDGRMADKLDKRPSDFSNPKLWQQSDGALLWKITEGHKPMPTFKDLTSDEERWPVINYIRTLAPKRADTNQRKTETKRTKP